MAKILGSSRVSGNIPKLIETSENFIINAQTYDKNTFSAKALDFCPMYGTPKNEILLRSTTYMESNWSHNRTDMNFITDNNDPNITYIATPGIYGANGSIQKITKTTVGYTMATITGSSYNDIWQFVGQDNAKVYGVLQRSQNSYGYFFSIDKATFAITYTTIGACAIKILKETESFFYFTANYYQRNYVMKFNKNTNTITTLLDDTLPSSDNYRCLSTSLGDANEVYFMRDSILTTGAHRVAYRKYTLDSNKDVVSVVDMITDMSIKPGQAIPFPPSSDPIKHELFFVKDNGKTYLSHVVYNNGTTVGLTPDKSGMYTYEITGVNTMKMVSFKEFSPTIYKGMMNMYDNKLLLLGNESCLHFYNWNSATTSFEKTTGTDSPMMAFGSDMNNNIYMQYTDSSVEMLSNTLPITIYADFQYDLYTYNGQEIDATLDVYARNFLNQYLNTSVELILFGPVRFADTGLKKKTITTSNLNTLSLPVIIDGEGILKVNTKVI